MAFQSGAFQAGGAFQQETTSRPPRKRRLPIPYESRAAVLSAQPRITLVPQRKRWS